MNRIPSVIDSVSVTRATDTALHYGSETVEHALGYLRDDKRKERREKGECKFCFYIHASRIGGAAMTSQACGLCGKDCLYTSTNTDKICLPCALEHQLCKYCGADLELRPRRILK